MPKYEGIANASAAVALDDDHFVVADDERKYLSLYRLGDRKPKGLWKFKERLGERIRQEPDLEGAAMIRDTIFWISSHGTDDNGQPAPDRQMLFATRDNGIRDGLELEPVGQVYRTLLDDMQADETLRKVFRFPDVRTIPPKQKGGISIEGLSATANEGLLIGFRNPLVRGLAIALEMYNPFDVIRGEAPLFSPPIFLELGGRGIRSIERVNGHEYLVVAGPYGKGDKPGPALFHWSGNMRDKPRLRQLDLPGDFNPEAVFVTPDGSKACVLSDDGRFYKGNDKRKGEKEFRAVVFDPQQILGDG